MEAVLLNLTGLLASMPTGILEGEKPADLPVQQAVKVELVIKPQDRQGAWPHRSDRPADPRRRSGASSSGF
jgi:hypothetical protein